MTNALATTGATMSLMDPGTLDHMWRVGKLLALSPLFPEHLRKGGEQTAIANGVLVCNMAVRLREDPLTVAQNIYFVSGKPGWSASYMISKANQHGVFKDPIDWEVEGQGDSLAVTAFGVLKSTKKRVQVTISMETAKAEGWTKNAKYKTMPEQMLRYRSATALIRLYCPEVMVGVPATTDELENPGGMRDVTPYAPPPAAEPAPAIAKVEPKKEPSQPEAAATEAEPAAPEPEAEGDAAPSRKEMENHRDAIINDLNDSGGMDGVLEFYEAQISEMKKHSPDLHQEIMDAHAELNAEAA